MSYDIDSYLILCLLYYSFIFIVQTLNAREEEENWCSPMGDIEVNTYKFLERKKKLENGLKEALIMVFLIIKKSTFWNMKKKN